MIGATANAWMALLENARVRSCPWFRVAEFRAFCIMMRNGIAQFVGSWISETGYHLRIKKVRKDRASVDFLDPRGAPVQRPYMGGTPSLKMIAHYDDYNGIFEVDLWEEGKGFILDLTPVRLRTGPEATRSARASPQPK
jgi:hypothetical protein